MKNYTKKKLIPLLFVAVPTSLLLLFLLGFLLVVAYLSYSRPDVRPYLWPVFIFYTFLFFVIIRPLGERIMNYVQGEMGEDEVIDKLTKLGSDSVVLKNLVFPNIKIGNIDLVVIDGRGVAAIEVKSHWGRVYLENGKLRRIRGFFEKDFINQASSEARVLQAVLKNELKMFVPVQPIIVFSSSHASVKFGLNPMRGTNVVVVGYDWVEKALLRRKGYLSAKGIQKISNCLSKYSQE